MQSDIDHTLFTGGNAGDNTLFVKFEDKPVKDKSATAKEGRPIFKEEPHISIRAAGATSFVCRKASQADKTRFPNHWAAFENKREMPISGTLLKEWPLITRTQAMEFEAEGIRTVEELVNMSDLHGQKFMGINGMKQKAKLFLEHASGEAPMLRLQEELEDRDRKLEHQQILIDNLSTRLAQLETPVTNKVEVEVMDEPVAEVVQAVAKPRTSRRKTK